MTYSDHLCIIVVEVIKALALGRQQDTTEVGVVHLLLTWPAEEVGLRIGVAKVEKAEVAAVTPDRGANVCVDKQPTSTPFEVGVDELEAAEIVTLTPDLKSQSTRRSRSHGAAPSKLEAAESVTVTPYRRSSRSRSQRARPSKLEAAESVTVTPDREPIAPITQPTSTPSRNSKQPNPSRSLPIEDRADHAANEHALRNSKQPNPSRSLPIEDRADHAANAHALRNSKQPNPSRLLPIEDRADHAANEHALRKLEAAESDTVTSDRRANVRADHIVVVRHHVI
ncbi:hypothetical protein KIN20_034191 [Parelaphostrongylus tenuis]|uniref:Uncharacterized protein n=1 Tax=Parelaphostrongylus tenuis TaxID=148309 RepID=A0AAD5R9Z9_PARTN|nr:hypothetical protein KIN20_034191 [Parelaphostrongylus tenuis]